MNLQQLIDAKKHQLFFIELNKDITLGDQVVKKGLDLPVDPDALKSMVTEGHDHFDFKQMLRDLCLIIGLDPSFKHNQQYRQLVGMTVSNPHNYCMNLGIGASAHGQWVEAVAFFKAALEFEVNFDAYYHLGRVHYAMAIASTPIAGALSEARHYLELANSLEHRPEIDYYLTFVLHLEERHVEALELAQQVLKSELEEQLMLDLLGKMPALEDRAAYQTGIDLILDERFQEGLEALLTLSEAALDDWRVQFFIGLGYRGTYQLSLSMQHLLRAKALNPAEDRIYNELGIVAMMLEDFAAAKGFFAEGLKIKPLNSDMLCNMAILHIEAGEWAQAGKFIDEAINIDPEDPIVLQTKAYLEANRPHEEVRH